MVYKLSVINKSRKIIVLFLIAAVGLATVVCCCLDRLAEAAPTKAVSEHCAKHAKMDHAQESAKPAQTNNCECNKNFNGVLSESFQIKLQSASYEVLTIVFSLVIPDQFQDTYQLSALLQFPPGKNYPSLPLYFKHSNLRL